MCVCVFFWLREVRGGKKEVFDVVALHFQESQTRHQCRTFSFPFLFIFYNLQCKHDVVVTLVFSVEVAAAAAAAVVVSLPSGSEKKGSGDWLLSLR